MKLFDVENQDESIPHLRVYWGDGDDEVGGRSPSDSAFQAQQEWFKKEAYWAGRNRAERLSARLVA